LTGPAPLWRVGVRRLVLEILRFTPSRTTHDLLEEFRANAVTLLDTLSVDTDWKREKPIRCAGRGSLITDGSSARATHGTAGKNAEHVLAASASSWANGQGLAVTVNIHPSSARTILPGTRPQAALRGCAVDRPMPGADGRRAMRRLDWARTRQLDAYFALHAPLERKGVDFLVDWCCDESRAQAPGLTADTLINSQLRPPRGGPRGARARRSRDRASFQGPGWMVTPAWRRSGAFAEHRDSIT